MHPSTMEVPAGCSKMSRVRQSHRKGTWLWSTYQGTIAAELDLRLGTRLVGPDRLTSRPLPTTIRDLVAHDVSMCSIASDEHHDLRSRRYRSTLARKCW